MRPESGEALATLAGVEGFRADSRNSSSDSTAIAAVNARATARGLVVHQLPDGGFIVAMRSWSCEIGDTDALARFLDRYEGRS